MTSEISKSTWFRTWPARNGQPIARLICFPHAGVGASLCNGWSESLPDSVELMAVQLPGRENRLQEPPLRDFEPLKLALRQILPNYIDLPMGLFGYSFGGTIAFEIAREMTDHDAPPCHLFVGAIAAPQLERAVSSISELPDEAFIAEIQANFGGIPPQVAEEPELLKMVLPAMRADMHIIETYRYQPGRPLPCPITALGGSDDPVATMADLSRWSELTTGRFRHRIYTGRHFFVREHYPQIMRYVGQQLEQHVAVATA